ncbi:MAG: L,D-transpeptidase [Betaproteobacteria bacterium]|nr:L,D-transpeptidase [Betaproteobacteria bacterium]
MIILRSVFYTLFALVIQCSSVFSYAASQQPWVLVDTQNDVLTVFSAADHVIIRFHNIAIGSGGTAEVHRKGDDTTPLGTFHVAWINHHSRFGTFFGFDYPSSGMAIRAYAKGNITGAEFDAIIDAFRRHRIPPQNTSLGGQLGIHGLGSGNLRVQQSVDWTDGCVAITNREIKTLSLWVHVGTRVVIR